MPLHPEGFACELFSEDVSAFECELCQCVVREPVEHAVCSQLYCTDCIKLALTKMRPPACPHCMTPASLADFRRINRVLRQMLDAKQMQCVHFPECSHVCTFGTLEKHLSECALQTVECRFDGCGAQVLRRDLAEHEANCARRTQRCEFCDEAVLVSSMETHTQSFCRRAPVPCKFCEVCVPREGMSTHHAHDCEKQPVKCVIEGCTHTMPKHEVQAHLDANLSGHLAQMQQQMLDMRKMVSELNDQVAALRLELSQKDEAITELRNQLQSTRSSGGFGLAPATGFGAAAAAQGESGFKSFGQARKKGFSRPESQPQPQSQFSFARPGGNPFMTAEAAANAAPAPPPPPPPPTAGRAAAAAPAAGFSGFSFSLSS